MLRKDNADVLFVLSLSSYTWLFLVLTHSLTFKRPSLTAQTSTREMVIALPLKWRDILREGFRIRFLSTRHRWSGGCECLPHCTMHTCFQMWPSSVNCANAINKASHLSPKCSKLKHARRWNKATNSRPRKMSSWWLYLVNSFGRQEARKLI